MPDFNGISEQVFNSCQRSEKIRIPINTLKDLQAVIEPELRKINPQIKGHVSRTKDRASNNYRNWAWLYFNTQPKEAYRYSQLSVNISPNRLYVGVDIRTPGEYQNYKKEITKPMNAQHIENLASILSTRDLFFSTESGDWEKVIPRKHSVEELKGQLLAPDLFWINIPFEKDDPKLASRQIAKEIFDIFRDLYNVYAFASSNRTISQNPPSRRPFVPAVVIENVDSAIEPDEVEDNDIIAFLSSLKKSSNESNHYLPGKNDQYVVKRKALEYNLQPYKLDNKGESLTIYSDRNITFFKDQVLQDYAQFIKILNELSDLFPLPKDFLKIMFVNPLTDARYSKNNDGNLIFVNLAAFHTRRNRFFWLFTISRELAYIRTHQLGYPFFKDMRRLMVHALNRQFYKNT
jgi:hypothetical protein